MLDFADDAQIFVGLATVVTREIPTYLACIVEHEFQNALAQIVTTVLRCATLFTCTAAEESLENGRRFTSFTTGVDGVRQDMWVE